MILKVGCLVVNVSRSRLLSSQCFSKSVVGLSMLCLKSVVGLCMFSESVVRLSMFLNIGCWIVNVPQNRLLGCPALSASVARWCIELFNHCEEAASEK